MIILSWNPVAISRTITQILGLFVLNWTHISWWKCWIKMTINIWISRKLEQVSKCQLIGITVVQTTCTDKHVEIWRGVKIREYPTQIDTYQLSTSTFHPETHTLHTHPHSLSLWTHSTLNIFTHIWTASNLLHRIKHRTVFEVFLEQISLHNNFRRASQNLYNT